MAYIDKQNEYSDAQAITASAASTNVIDHTVTGIGPGTPIEVVVQVVEDFDAGTVVAALQTATDAAFTTPVTLVQTAAIAAATLVAGYQFALSTLPQHMLQFSRIYFTVTGTPTTGAVDAHLALDRQTA